LFWGSFLPPLSGQSEEIELHEVKWIGGWSSSPVGSVVHVQWVWIEVKHAGKMELGDRKDVWHTQEVIGGERSLR
jgi:hypothetical protein